MNLLIVGCSYRNTPVEIRERLAFDGSKLTRALEALNERFGCEVVVLSTCNRVELYVGQVIDGSTAPITGDDLVRFLAEFHGLAIDEIRPHLYVHRDAGAVRHLLRVSGSLDSMIVGEGQIAGQVKIAYETACEHATVGSLLHALFRHARLVARRVRTETQIAMGHVSVSSVAVDYVRQVFDSFADKTILVIGAGKMGELTLKHLQALRPRQIVVTNRSPEKAVAVAAGCGGQAAPWDRLDDLLVEADIVLSTTGAPEPIMMRRRFDPILARRTGGPIVILDIAVPRDFDPRIHDGDRACLFNIDDLKRIRETTLAERARHIAPAEAIVEQETRRFLNEWQRRRNGPVIARLTQEVESKGQAILKKVLTRLNGRLTDADRKYIEGAFRLFGNQILHGPISALTEESQAESSGHTLLEALRKLFGLHE